MARRIATVSGYALRPGVSRNGRLYTPDLIRGAVERAQDRLGTGDLHLVDRTARVLDQRTHHAADDDSTRIVGRITKLTLEDDGSARFEADLADTHHGRTIAALIAPKGEGPDEVEPFLTGVSIRGAWRGQVRRQQHEGRTVETADGLDLDGLDYTGRPGVDGAVVDGFTPAAGGRPPAEADHERVLIFESVQEASVTTLIEEAAASGSDGAEPYGDVVYADPGYQKDKKKRYPLNSKARAKSAWSYINEPDNARLYTSAQLKRVKARIVKALKGFGVTVATQERWLIEPAAQVTEALAECWGMDPTTNGDLYLSLTNGPTTVTVSSRLLDPHDLDAVGRAAMAGACSALAALDPDMDADIDVPGAEPEDDDQDADSMPGSACPCGCGCAIPDQAATSSGCPCRCGCMVCHATAAAFGTPESTQPAVAGQPLTPEHAAALEASGVLEDAPPGTYVTAAAVNEALATQTPAPDPAAETTPQEKEPAMAESTPTPAAETPGSTDGIDALGAKIDQLSAALAGFVTAMTPKPQESAPPAAEAPVAEQAAEPAPVTETDDQRIARLVAEGIAAALPKAVQEHVESTGGPARKGLVSAVTETTAPAAGALPDGWPAKPLHQYTNEEWRTFVAPNTVGAILGSRAELPAQ